MTITLLQGDCRTVLPGLADASIQCVVTSPPYFGLRKYQVEGEQIGAEPTPAAYVAALVDVFREVGRVLRADGVLWLSLGDSYTRNGGTPGGGNRELMHLEGKQTRMTRIPADLDLAEKNLIGIPWRVAFALQDDGWILRSDIIWHKPNCMPESVTDRPTRAHEYIFLLSKSARYYYDAAAIAEKSTGQTGRAANFARATKDHIIPGQSAAQHRLDRTPTADTGSRNARTVWTIPTRPYAEAHFATFPEELARRCILAGSRPGDTILDPFAGSGTTMRVAEQYGRDAIGIDLGYQELQEKRTDGVQRRMEAYL